MAASEKIKAALAQVDTEKLAQAIPEEVKTALARGVGVDGLLARLHGVKSIDEKTASQIIGERFLQRRAEARLIRDGLRAFESLKGS